MRTSAELQEIREAIDRETRRRNLPLLRSRLHRDGDFLREPKVSAPAAESNGNESAVTRTQRQILALLRERPLRTQEIARIRGTSDASVYEHLRSLVAEGLVVRPKPGLYAAVGHEASEAVGAVLPPDPAGEAPSFADVADALEAAREALTDAEGGYRDALRRFVEHPTFAAIRDDLELAVEL